MNLPWSRGITASQRITKDWMLIRMPDQGKQVRLGDPRVVRGEGELALRDGGACATVSPQPKEFLTVLV